MAQRFGGAVRPQPNTIAPIPIQVWGEGRVENLSPNTTLTDNAGAGGNYSNLFAGHWCTNGTWILYTNGGTTKPSVITADPFENLYGFFMPTVTQPIKTVPATNQVFYYQCDLGGDVCPKFTYSNNGGGPDGPVVMVAGFTLSVSNWTGATARGYDTFRIGQSPYIIVQFNDDQFQFTGVNHFLLAHTPDGPQVGDYVAVLDNGEVYIILVLFDQPNSIGRVAVIQKLRSGRYRRVGESYLAMTGSTEGANVIFFGQHDDHSPASGTPGKIRLGNFFMVSTNREDYFNLVFPRY